MVVYFGPQRVSVMRMVWIFLCCHITELERNERSSGTFSTPYLHTILLEGTVKVLVCSMGSPRVGHVTIYVHRYIADVCQGFSSSSVRVLSAISDDCFLNLLLLI